MKKIIFGTLCALLCVACKPAFHPRALKGDGNIVTLEIPISDYCRIKTECGIDIHYCQTTGEPYLRITADSNLIAALNPRVEDSCLLLTYKGFSLSKVFVEGAPTLIPSQGKIVVYTNSSSLKGLKDNFGFMNSEDRYSDSSRIEYYSKFSSNRTVYAVLGDSLMGNPPSRMRTLDIVFERPNMLHAPLHYTYDFEDMSDDFEDMSDDFEDMKDDLKDMLDEIVVF